MSLNIIIITIVILIISVIKIIIKNYIIYFIKYFELFLSCQLIIISMAFTKVIVIYTNKIFHI